MDCTDPYLICLIRANWSWAAGLSAALLGLTALAAKLLAPARKESLALWLMGAQGEESWSRSFCALFDAVFGDRHFSWRCFWRSTVASLAAVALIWTLMGGAGLIGLRLETDLSLGRLLLYALAVNVVADYISLLETRWLLGRLHRWRGWQQALALVADLFVTAAIIWAAIRLLAGPILGLEPESFAEVLGVFSVLSVLFYSTFLTSVWSWAYVAAIGVLRLFTRAGLATWLDVENKPVTMLGYVLAALVFVGGQAVAIPLRAGEDGLTRFDRALCEAFPGEVCLRVAGLTPLEQVKLDLITRACEGGVTEECLKRGLDLFKVTQAEAVRLWAAACAGGHAMICSNLGVFHERGIGMEADPDEATRLYARSCEGGHAPGCTNLGLLLTKGGGIDPDHAEAARLYALGCEGGDALGCFNLGVRYQRGVGVDVDPAEAARLYARACEGGYAGACTNLGLLKGRGIGVEQEPAEAARLYARGCEGGDALGCSNLGVLHEEGINVDADLAEAARLYARACEEGNARGCAQLGSLRIADGQDFAAAARLFEKACSARDWAACGALGVLFESGQGVKRNLGRAHRLYRQACDEGIGNACAYLDHLSTAQ